MEENAIKREKEIKTQFSKVLTYCERNYKSGFDEKGQIEGLVRKSNTSVENQIDVRLSEKRDNEKEIEAGIEVEQGIKKIIEIKFRPKKSRI